MALIACRECGNEISTDARACPKCGAINRQPKSKTWLLIPLFLIAVVFIWGLSISNTPEAKAKARERAAIDMCWEEHERKSLDPATQRFVASTCEMMEDKFRKEHGVNP